MVYTFRFTNPDGTTQMIDITAMTGGFDTAVLRGEGIRIARLFPGTCDYIAREVNLALRETSGRPDAVQIRESDPAEAIGCSIGTHIYRHMRAGEETADIWSEVAQSLMQRAGGNAPLHIFTV